MSNKIVFLSILLITAVFVSVFIFKGDTGTPKNNQTIVPEFIPQANLPPGFTFMGIHETKLDIGNSSMKAIEGVYRYNEDDVYIQAIKSDDPDALIDRYKLQYNNKKYNPFQEISLNGHMATQVTDYTTIMGQQKPFYSIIWPKGDYMILVGSSSEARAVINLATATGY